MAVARILECVPLITLTTDFGLRDPYVAIMKGVIAQVAPKAQVVDVTHDIPAFSILHAAHILRAIRPWFPPGTIHVAIIDPGVGGERRILLARTRGQFFLAPDNGVMTCVHREAPIEELIVVENRHYFLADVSSTFHGRDIFAPVAAHLAEGVRPQRLGRRTDRLELLPADLERVFTRDGVSGRVIYADRFGNLITNITAGDLGSLRRRGRCEVRVNDAPIGPVRSTYGDAPPGQPLALFGSSGLLEIAVNQGSALAHFGRIDGLAITVREATA